MGEATPLVEVRQLTLRFGGVTALQDVSFDVYRGELLAIIGPNGAGKTSVFNVLNGIYPPTAGTIRFDGRQIEGLRPAPIARLGLARTFQNLALFTNLDVIDNLLLGRHHRMTTGMLAAVVWFGRARREEIEHRRRCEEIAEILDLTEHIGRPVGLLPYGVQKRVEVGRAVAMEPELLLLDEPVAGMNLEETEQMAHTILAMQADLGLTMVLVEHDMHLVMDLAERVVALDFGHVLATGTPDEVAEHPAVVESYLGTGA